MLDCQRTGDEGLYPALAYITLPGGPYELSELQVLSSE